MTDRVLNFKGFLYESENQPKVKIIMLSGGEFKGSISEPLAKECKKRKIGFHFVNTTESEMEKSDLGHTIITPDGKVKIDPETSAILLRAGMIKSVHSEAIVEELTASGYFIVNSLKSMQICTNKYISGEYLERAGLPVPRTVLLSNEDIDLDIIVKKIGGKFPIIMKLLNGSRGIGVSIVESQNSFKSVYQTLKKLDPDNEVIIQEMIDSDSDIRIHVLNGKIIGLMQRTTGSDDFRTNYSLGGSVSKIKISKEIEDIAIKAASVVGCIWCGVDIMIDKKTKKPYLLEVNSSPGVEGISKVLGSPIVNKIIGFLIDKENWKYTLTEAGYLEVIDIEGIGKVVGLLDSGNGGLTSSIHCDEIKVKNGYVYWKIGNKKFKNKLVREVVVYPGANNSRITEKRPIIKLNVDFNGTKLPIDVSVVDRGKKSAPFLFNRKLIKHLKLMINSNEIFMVTKCFDPDYDPKKSKGNPRSGVEFMMKNK